MKTFGADVELADWDVIRSAAVGQRAEAIFRVFGIVRPLSLGGYDAELLSAYAERFAPTLDGIAYCPACGTDVELSIDIADLKASIGPTSPVEPLVIDGVLIEWRLPDLTDLQAIATASDVDEGARILLSRCIVGGADRDGELPEGVRGVLAENIAAADPYADLTVTLICPACNESWDSALDVVEFVWAAMQSRARRLLLDVNELARCYGWSERQILELPQGRRDAYLELIRGG